MANVDLPSQQLTDLDPARVYEANVELIYQTVRCFLPEAAAAEAIEAIALELLSTIPDSGYRRYSRLLCLRATFTQLLSDARSKVPRDFSLRNNSNQADATPELTLTEAICLFLRDRLELSCFEIAAVAGASEGSIRTRLERTRGRVFSTTSNERFARSDNAAHLCIKSREAIEDWNVTQARLGQFTVPPHVIRAVGDCAKCEATLNARLSSLAQLRETSLYTPPEKLRTFPVSPLFVKEGKRMLLNWSAAPWYVKALFEGLLATTLVLGIVLSIPRIKSIYEFWLERRLDLYSIAELAAGLSGNRSEQVTESAATSAGNQTSTTPLATGSAPPTKDGVAPRPQNERLTVQPETEFIGRESDIVSSEKVYRVLIKTDSPESIKEQVMHALTAVHYTASDDDSIVGAELPGGVMFDIFVPLKSYKPLVNELSRMGETKIIITRAKERGAPGKAHLKIWLQRI